MSLGTCRDATADGCRARYGGRLVPVSPCFCGLCSSYWSGLEVPASRPTHQQVIGILCYEIHYYSFPTSAGSVDPLKSCSAVYPREELFLVSEELMLCFSY
jgi:hypothetical protein